MSTNRGNPYYLRRLKKEGRTDLLAEIGNGKISVYRATVLAGYRNKKPRNNAEALTVRWFKLDPKERLKFAADHYGELKRLIVKLSDHSKTQKKSE